ncbi:hypothetical protein ACHAPT_002156 [Fusarium lateritium]
MNVAGSSSDVWLKTGETTIPLNKARWVRLFLTDCSRGPVGSRNSQPVRHHDGKPVKQTNFAILAETMIRDIPKTEYHVFLYNQADAVIEDGMVLAPSKPPHWSDGPPQWSDSDMNPFFPEGTKGFREWNHYQAVIAQDQKAEENGERNLSLTIGHGGDEDKWEKGMPFHGLKPFEDLGQDIMGPYKCGICIRIKFELDLIPANEIDSSIGKPPLVPGVSAIYKPDPDQWFDTVRLEIAQKGFPHYFSLNMRFVERQGEDYLEPIPVQARLLNIDGVTLDDVVTKETARGDLDVVTYVVKLASPRKSEAGGDVTMKG